MCPMSDVQQKRSRKRRGYPRAWARRPSHDFSWARRAGADVADLIARKRLVISAIENLEAIGVTSNAVSMPRAWLLRQLWEMLTRDVIDDELYVAAGGA